MNALKTLEKIQQQYEVDVLVLVMPYIVQIQSNGKNQG